MQYREQLQRELVQLIQRQIETLEKETFGGLTNAELRDYEERRKRIHEMYDRLYHLDTAA